MPSIQKLPASVVNKIAAGEVIERPASAVKELLENAVDAGATRIDVSLEQGGVELVRVVDNGHGIPPEELPLAIASHATSKLRDADDLFQVHTLGFRGEALASLAEVSRFWLRSRTPDSPAGAELEVIGGEAGKVAPVGCPVGTSLEIRSLFFNTPVRRKFLRSTQTELGYCSEALLRIALAHPQVHFTLRHNERTTLELPAVTDWRERIAAAMGRELADALIPVESTDDGIHLSGYVALPTQSRANNRMQYLFLNGRFIRDRSLQHALGEAYRGLLLTGRYPIGFLRLDMPAAAVDVNVHPTKLEVRFQDGGRIYSQLLGTLRTRFLATDLTAKIQPNQGDSTGASFGQEANNAHDSAEAQRMRGELVAWAKGQLAQSTASASAAFSQQSDLSLAYPAAPRLEITRIDRVWEAPAQVPNANSHGLASGQDSTATLDPVSAPPQYAQMPNSAVPAPHRATAMQVHNRYLITEDAEGMVVIDQHALHERILYEQLREKVLGGQVESQKLLVPEPVDLSPREVAAALDHRDLFRQLGMEVEPFGGDTVLISSYPAMLANFAPAEVLRQLVDQILAEGKLPDRRDLLDELLHMFSCKAAIKAGDRLAPEEVTALVSLRHLVQDAHHCPHGRPTSLVFTRAQLDKMFLRT